MTVRRTGAESSERDARAPRQPDLRLGPAGIVRAQALIDDLNHAQSLQHCSLFLWDPAIGRLRLAAQHWGAGEDLGEVQAGAWTIGLNGICGRAFLSSAPVLIADVEDDPDYLGYPGSRTRSELAVPIVLDGRAVAVVNLESPRPAAYGPAQIEAVGGWIASVIELIRAFYSDPA